MSILYDLRYEFHKIGDSCDECGRNLSEVFKDNVCQEFLICEYCEEENKGDL